VNFPVLKTAESSHAAEEYQVNEGNATKVD